MSNFAALLRALTPILVAQIENRVTGQPCPHRLVTLRVTHQRDWPTGFDVAYRLWQCQVCHAAEEVRL